MAVDILLGLQWGDEGKGKIVDVFTKKYDIVARFQGGPNAGHTLEFDGHKHVLHTIPSGIFHDGVNNLIGNGVVIDPITLSKELEEIEPHQADIYDKLCVSRKAHLILPTHRLLDLYSETMKGKTKIGSTLKGIGPTYMDKTGRNGIRVGDLELADWKERYQALRDKHIEMLDAYKITISYNLEELEEDFFKALSCLKKIKFIDSEEYLQQAMIDKQTILAEGAQGSLLDIDFGTYPFVTSSTTTAAGACTGMGVAPNKIKEVFGVFKAYATRVGSGPFPTELFDSVGEKICDIGREYGATTGRKRRCGWLDLVALRYAVQVNGVTQLIMMKNDVLSGFDKIKVCTAYKYRGQEQEYLPYNIDAENIEPVYQEFDGWVEDLTKVTDYEKLPSNFTKYVTFLEQALQVPVKVISVGPDRIQTIFR